MSADAHHLTAPHPEGPGAALAMRRALAHAGVGARRRRLRQRPRHRHAAERRHRGRPRSDAVFGDARVPARGELDQGGARPHARRRRRDRGPDDRARASRRLPAADRQPRRARSGVATSTSCRARAGRRRCATRSPTRTASAATTRRWCSAVPEKVVVTGVGVVSPLGSLPVFWKRLCAGESGIAPVLGRRAAPRAPRLEARAATGTRATTCEPALLRRMDRCSQMIVTACRMALADAVLDLTGARSRSGRRGRRHRLRQPERVGRFPARALRQRSRRS